MTWYWPWQPEYWIDLGPAYNMMLGGILVFAGLFALWAVPGKMIKLIVGGGMIIGGLALMMGYVAVW